MLFLFLLLLLSVLLVAVALPVSHPEVISSNSSLFLSESTQMN